MKKIIVFSAIMLSLLNTCTAIGAKSYKSSFSGRSLRSKFGLSGSGFEWVPKVQKRFEKAKERDYKILLRKMKENN